MIIFRLSYQTGVLCPCLRGTFLRQGNVGIPSPVRPVSPLPLQLFREDPLALRDLGIFPRTWFMGALDGASDNVRLQQTNENRRQWRDMSDIERKLTKLVCVCLLSLLSGCC